MGPRAMTRHGRMGLAVTAATTVVVLAAAACAPMPPGGSTTTTVPGTWLAAGCLDGAGTDGSAAPDLLFNGTPNSRGNATFFATISNGTLALVGNGSCVGLPAGAITIVRATNEVNAGLLCEAASSGATATSFTGSPWTAPADAWACSDTIPL